MPKSGSSRPSACAGAPGRCPPTRRRPLPFLITWREKCLCDRAFALLVRHSLQENIKLREHSERVVRSGELGRT